MSAAVLLSAALFAFGLWLTMRGGDAFVDASCVIARVSGVPQVVIGATIVSLCTTAPELTVSLLATLHGAADLAIGNAVGSAACNISLILGLIALFAPPKFDRRDARARGGLLLVTLMVLGTTTVDGALGLVECGVLSLLLILFLCCNLRSVSMLSDQKLARPHLDGGQKAGLALRFVLGAGGVVLGAKLLVDNAAALARFAGISETVIGLTLVAIGTSLPELVTALTAIRRREGALSVGNIIGANIIDLALVLPVCALANGGALPISSLCSTRDLPVTLILTAVALLPTMFTGRFHRMQGFGLLVLYGAYTAALLT